MKSKKLKILCLEDNEDDAIIIRELLISEGLTLEFDHVLNENEFTEKLKTKRYDMVLSDYNLPGFNGIAALMLSRKICPDVPFICISGTIGEDLAVELLHLGASDYIMKDRLFPLPAAIQSALDEYEVKKARILAENELKESREKYKNLVENINDVVYEIDNTGIITYMSPIITEITGFPDSYYTGKPLFSFINERDIETTREKFEKIISSGMINPFEFRIIDNLANIIWLRTSSKPMIREGKIIGIRGTAIDITRSKLADEQIRKLSRAMEQSPASVVITDINGIIEYVNPKFTELTSYSLAEVSGKTPMFLKSGYTMKEEYENLWKTIKSGEEWRGEFHNRRKDGSLYWEQASISSIKDSEGNITHFLAVKEDITERKKLTFDMIDAKVRAEASDKLKTAFLNNISHEVRTPLNGILGFAEFVLQPDLQQEEKDLYLRILNESSDRLLNTITNYMDISLIVSGNMNVKSTQINVTKILEKIYNLFLPGCKTKGLNLITHFQAGITPRIIGDEELLEKAISHLLDNAVKFTSTGTVTIGLSIVDKTLGIFIKDTGKGIDPESQKAIYDVFMQGEVSNTRGYEGSGLGLSIARGIVELLGGKISLESEKGKGSVFFMKFNYENINEEVQLVQNEEINLSDSKSLLVLIAEDDESNASFLKVLFSKHSLKFIIASNGKEAVDICHSNPDISLILMDIKMPIMDGLEATRRIKEFRKQLPIVALTSYAMTGDKDKALNAGCDDYLTKPVKSEQLFSLINRYINK